MLSALLAGAFAYTLDTDMSGSTFFDNFNFETFASPTHGYSKYSPESAGLTSVEDGKAFIRVDTTESVPSGGRPTIRLHSKKTWTEGLFILDATHMPQGCAVWPAWWFDGPHWPNGGEIDVVEYVNTGVHNHATLHTSAGCTQYNPAAHTGSQSSGQCDAHVNGNAGCGFTSDNAHTCGSGFNDVGGGVVAMEFVQGSNGFIKVWNFERDSIPGDITDGNPKPDSWGTPSAHFTLGSNCPGSHFAAQTMILNTELCGDWAGANGVYNGEYKCGQQTGQYNCVDLVKYHGSEFDKAYWEINSIKVYTGRPAPSPQPSGDCTAYGQDPYGTGHLVQCCSGMKKCLERSANWEYRCKTCSDSCPDDKGWNGRQCSTDDTPEEEEEEEFSWLNPAHRPWSTKATEEDFEEPNEDVEEECGTEGSMCSKAMQYKQGSCCEGYTCENMWMNGGSMTQYECQKKEQPKCQKKGELCDFAGCCPGLECEKALTPCLPTADLKETARRLV